MMVMCRVAGLLYGYNFHTVMRRVVRAQNVADVRGDGHAEDDEREREGEEIPRHLDSVSRYYVIKAA
jgi:hypothetical protein